MKKHINKRNIIITAISLSVIVVAIIVKIFFFDYLDKKQLNHDQKLYDEIHNLYNYGGNLDFELTKEIDGYTKIKNYEEVENIVSKNLIEKTNTFLKIKKIENDYYMKRIGRGVSNYYGTTLVRKNKSYKKINYTAISKFCPYEHITAYGCEVGYEYQIEMPFTVVKEQGKWKIDEYTSIFEFDESVYK